MGTVGSVTMHHPLLLVLLCMALVGRVLLEANQPWCKPCKEVEGDGPLAGQYYLQSDSDSRCDDHCSYARGEDLYCFVPGQEVVNPCGDEPWPGTGSGLGPTPDSGNTTPDMKPVTFLPPAGTDSPPPEGVRCGLRRSGGECVKDGRIVNGQEAGCNEWPWQVGIVARSGEYVSGPFCGGTLINQNHVITAAHCMFNRDGSAQTTDSIAVMIGDHDINVMEPGQNAYAVSAIFNHPDYDGSTTANDLTVLRISSNINTTVWSPACFPTFSTGQSLHGKNGTISGWGALEYYTGDYPDTLQEVQDLIPIVDRDTCVDGTEPYIYDSDILPGMLCAGGPGLGMDTCQGDSGGPLTHQFTTNQYELVGVVSWGSDCAKSYGVYTDVAYYRAWIESKTGALFMSS